MALRGRECSHIASCLYKHGFKLIASCDDAIRVGGGVYNNTFASGTYSHSLIDTIYSISHNWKGLLEVISQGIPLCSACLSVNSVGLQTAHLAYHTRPSPTA